MRFGPTIIRRCSECSCLIKDFTVASGNTVGAICWTDGRCYMPMLPDELWFVKCPHCQALLWIDEQEEEGAIESFNDNGPYKDAEQYGVPELQDYYAELNKDNLGINKEQYLRLRAWWIGNDSRRDSSTKQALSEKEIENLQALDKLLDPADDEDRLMKAEIKRELGRFEEAEDILKEPFPADFAEDVSFIRKLIQRREPFVEEMRFED